MTCSSGPPFWRSATAADSGQCRDRDPRGEQPAVSGSARDREPVASLDRPHELRECGTRRGTDVPRGRRHGRACRLWRAHRRCARHSGCRSCYCWRSGFSGSVGICSGCSTAILGVILFLTGSQLALGSCDFSKNKGERFITIATAAFSMWNVGLAFVVGMVLSYLLRRGHLRL